MSKTDVEDSRITHLFGIGFVLAFLLPHTSTPLLMVNPLLCIFYKIIQQNRKWDRIGWIVLLPLLVTFVLNVGQGVSLKSQQSFFTILLYIMCFPIVSNVQIKNGYLYFIFSVIFLSQIANVYHITFLSNFFETYYPISDEDMDYYLHVQNNISTDNMFNYRLGGLYHNSNNCSRAVTLLLATYLYVNRDKSIVGILLFSVISLFSVLQTGSRTGFFVAGLLIIVFLFSKGDVKQYWKIVFTILLLGFFLYMITTGSDTYRSLNLEDALEGSGAKKYNTFKSYLLHETSILKMLFGYLDATRFERSSSEFMTFFDSDYGSLIFKFGFVGFISILMFFYKIYKHYDRNNAFIFVVLLWMISSTIVSSYRAFFIFMLMLSVVYSNTKKIHNQE